ncbi:hypothetical protein UPYG_G00224930 [Umbra pygmaea]|uniref:Uncharacterized protein n=1 Tax=Umbra pygmaea TaxID=75934 RepID=A0ABD0WH35_UMBPY
MDSFVVSNSTKHQFTKTDPVANILPKALRKEGQEDSKRIIFSVKENKLRNTPYSSLSGLLISLSPD